MVERKQPPRDMVICEMCKKEIPRSTAQTAEGSDYTYFFCGEGCHQRWLADRRVDDEMRRRR